MKSAFRGYFEKSLEEATIAEAAQVAGLLVAPGKYSPYVNPKKAKSRQRYVLKKNEGNRQKFQRKNSKLQLMRKLNSDYDVQTNLKQAILRIGFGKELFHYWVRRIF